MSARLTAVTLAGLAALHVAWGAGSSVPFDDRDDLADAVVGTTAVPSQAACFMVAGALSTAAALVLGLPAGRPALRRAGLLGVTTVLGGRGLLGVVARTDLVSPGSTSPRFRQLDRRLYAPLCLALAGGTWSAARASRRNCP